MTRKEFEDLVPGTLVGGECGCRAVYIGRAHSLVSMYDPSGYRVFKYIDPPLSYKINWSDINNSPRPGWFLYRYDTELYDMTEILEVLCVP